MDLMFGFSREHMCQNAVALPQGFTSWLNNIQQCILIEYKPSSPQKSWYKNLDDSKHTEYE